MRNNTYPLIDLHADYVLSCYEKGGGYGTASQINASLLKSTNVKIFFAGFSYDDLLKDTDLQFSILQKEAKTKKFTLIQSKKDFSGLDSQDKIGMVFHLEGALVFNGDIDVFHDYYKKGVRAIGLTHNYKNSLAAGCREDANLPLTSFGKEVVKLCNKLGIVVDAAHINEKGFYDLLETSTKPVIVTHGNARALCPHPRNYTDDQLKALASQGGVIGIFFSSKYVKDDGTPVTIDDVVKHFVYIANLIGVDYLAIGSDFGGITTGVPKGLENMGMLPDLYERLRKAGFSEQDLEKITYENAQKVLTSIFV